MVDVAPLLHAQRAASDTIRGYLSQTLWSVLRWFDLGPDEYLLCEGNEDIDRLLFDRDGRLLLRIEEQIKDLAQRVSARDAPVHESIFNFLRAFHAHHKNGHRCKLVFTTTAAIRQQQIRSASAPEDATGTSGARLDIDVLKTWLELAAPTTPASGRANALAKLPPAIKELARHYLPTPDPKTSPAEAEHVARVLDAIAYLDGSPGRWAEFLEAVQWNFGQESLPQLREKLADRAAADARTKALPAELIVDRLIVEVLRAMSGPEPVDRVLTVARLRELAAQSEADLRQWALDVHQEALSGWIRLLDERLDEHERRLDHVEEVLSPEVQQKRRIAECIRALDDPECPRRQVEDMEARYFRVRVIPSLFVEPGGFEEHVTLFRRAPEAIQDLRTRLQDVLDRVPAVLAALQSLPHGRTPRTSEPDLLAPLQRCAGLLAAGTFEPDLRAEVGTLEKERGNLERHVAELAEGVPTDAHDPLAHVRVHTGQEWYRRTQRLLRDIGRIVADLRRVTSVVWCLSTPAGRGKSMFLWEVASRLRNGVDSLCLLTGRELDGLSPIEAIIARELRLGSLDSNTFLDAGRARWSATGRPVFILIDALNEARGDLRAAVDQVVRFMAVCEREPWLRLLVSCRDLYWETAFGPDLAAFAEHTVIDRQGAVMPQFGREVVEGYLAHFRVEGVVLDDFQGFAWHTNPLFLRVFCETYADRTYDGPKPIPLQSFHLLRGFFARKQSELRVRGFRTLLLEEELDKFAAAMIRTGREVTDATDRSRFVVAEQNARNLLSAVAHNETLYDALLDMDLVLRVDVEASMKQYVTFTFERIQDYFVARELLSRIEAVAQPLSDAFLDAEAQSSAVTGTARATAIALAVEQGSLTGLRTVPRSAAAGLAVILDLVEPEQLMPLEQDLISAAFEPEGVQALKDYLRDRIAAQNAERRTFLESFGLGVLAAAVLQLPLPERHRRFYSDQELVDALADVLERETAEMRDWARRGFTEFPRDISGPDGRLRTAVLLLGTNSPHVRDIAHEWLFWFGRFQPDRVCAFVDRYTTHDDLFIRERALALEFGLLHRLPRLATPERLLTIYQAALERSAPTYTTHYIITEFARKILLDHHTVIDTELTVEQWHQIEHPSRGRLVGDADKERYRRGSPEWVRRGPIDCDQSKYTFNHRFRDFIAETLDVAVKEALAELPSLGYNESFYEKLDALLWRASHNPRIWSTESGRRYERFGKSYAHQASWIILGRWAETVPIEPRVSDPERPFALDQPDYDYLFTLPTLKQPSDAAPAILDFPETHAPEVWEAHDETVHLDDFLVQFPGEVVLYGIVDRIKGDRELQTLTRCALILPQSEAAFAWATARLQAGRIEFYGHLPGEEISDAFEFHNLRAEARNLPPLTDDEPVVAAFADLVRTMNDGDRSVSTVSPRLILAADLRQLETAGEFVDASGECVVRLLEWGNYRDEHRGDLVLMKRETLEHACERLGLSYCFFDFFQLVSIDKERQYDERLNIARWAARFPRLATSPVPPFLNSVVDVWELRHGPLGLDLLVRCYRAAVERGERGLRVELTKIELEAVRHKKKWGGVAAGSRLLKSFGVGRNGRSSGKIYRPRLRRSRPPRRFLGRQRR